MRKLRLSAFCSIMLDRLAPPKCPASLSTNNSFEWVEHGGDNYYEPTNNIDPLTKDTVVDMGIRGMVPKWE